MFPVWFKLLITCNSACRITCDCTSIFPVTPYVKFPAVNCTRELPVPTVNENALGDFAVGIGFAGKPATKTSALPQS
ncbi:MAG: hypothetical protein CM15mV4_0550 [Caudoviricetes sp.]|nr:MAG: hypothetical protein CM15mV4_0550 [Caudoviricetes sp.]